MRTFLFCLLTGFSVVVFAATARAQEKVTIPKSRLEELERKEVELDRLKAGAQPARSATAPAASARTPASASAPASAASMAAAPAAPALAALPPVQPGERVSSTDLVSQFLANPANAEQRYRKHVIVVEGRVIRISKHLMRREYELVLEGPQAGQEVVCRLRAPDEYEAIYTTNQGGELVGTSRGLRTTLARTGTTAAIRGRCKGLKGAQVSFVAEPNAR